MVVRPGEGSRRTESGNGGVSSRLFRARVFRHSHGQVIFGHRGVDLDGRQFEAFGFLAEEFGEHPVTFEQLTKALSGSLVLPAILHGEPRLAKAARRNSGVGRSQTA